MQSKTPDVVSVLLLNVLIYARLGYRRIVMILDNARTHGLKMKTAFAALLVVLLENGDVPLGVSVTFLSTPRYSPRFNPAEYVIHAVRQRSLYHLPCHFTLQDKVQRIQQHLAQGPPFTPRQMANIWRYIGQSPKVGGF
jgi:transposase